MREAVPVSSVQVPPDPAITSAIGRHHSLETAIADLVDNSVDAGARTVQVRFLLEDGAAAGLQVLDDGCGMDTTAVDAAMRYAHRHARSESALGHFGVGLKAASLSQAETLLVWSRRFGAPAVGRRLRRSTLDSGPVVESFSTRDAERRLSSTDALPAARSGTLVEWQDVRAFLHDDDPTEQTKWLERAVETVLRHLGVVFHRLIERDTVVITVEVAEGGTSSAPRPVHALDPFGYPNTGALGYPSDFALTVPDGRASMRAHVWPSTGTSLRQYVLDGGGPLETQGLYVYRHDRLLQAGGWCDLVRVDPDLAYARVSVDVDGPLAAHVTINPEKTGVVLDAALADAILTAKAPGGHAFQDFLHTAGGHARDARSRRPRPISVVEPRGGLPATVHQAFEEATGFIDNADPFDIRWRSLPEDEFFEVDLEGRCLALNLKYRSVVVGRTKSMDPGDAALVKSLLFLLLNSHLSGSVTGARERRLQAAWQTILVAAVRTLPEPTAEA
ncbi:ATP-binding protein [Micrococcus luteus]|uniref:ATP-binding protein n=1 Tax=Micrococcus luteus TaxID=1270 RepID=UPI0029EE916C|nr:ATP-binding protein [Micrococcus luteus]